MVVSSQKKQEIKKPEHIFKEIREMYGPLAWHVMEILWEYHKKGKKISENKIAKLLNVDVHDVRKVLYLFQNQGVVFSRFWKINKKGWQINSWHINEENLYKLINSENENEKTEETYYCPSCGKKFTEEEALERNYFCDECEIILERKEDYQIEFDQEERIKEEALDNS